MKLSPERLLRVSQSTGYDKGIIEKVAYLLDVLGTMTTHPALKGKLALKGGCALNLFFLDVPRLSVDIDLNFIGTPEREGMLEQRPAVERAMQAVLSREGLAIRRVPSEHAGGKWRAGYLSAAGQPGMIEIDINFVHRIPLWEVRPHDSRPFGPLLVRNVPVVDIHELAAGKLTALFNRMRARDIFDTVRIAEMVDRRELMPDRLRIGLLVFGAAGRSDPRTFSPEAIDLDADDFVRELEPVLRTNAIVSGKDKTEFVRQLISDCKAFIGTLLPFAPAESRFLDLVWERGEIDASILTDDQDLQSRIRRHPMLAWKAKNIREQGEIR